VLQRARQLLELGVCQRLARVYVRVNGDKEGPVVGGEEVKQATKGETVRISGAELVWPCALPRVGAWALWLLRGHRRRCRGCQAGARYCAPAVKSHLRLRSSQRG
jgi:hypothetical protein